jgi:hypothetical protein
MYVVGFTGTSTHSGPSLYSLLNSCNADLNDPCHRNFPLKSNQGHTAHLTKAEADIEVRQILELYCQVYKDILAILGIKSKKEKFASGTSVEETVTAQATLIMKLHKK